MTVIPRTSRDEELSLRSGSSSCACIVICCGATATCSIETGGKVVRSTRGELHRVGSSIYVKDASSPGRCRRPTRWPKSALRATCGAAFSAHVFIRMPAACLSEMYREYAVIW